MGKPTGFMENPRLAEAYEPAEARLKHYREFVATLNDQNVQPGFRHYTGGSTSRHTCTHDNCVKFFVRHAFAPSPP